MQKETLGLLSKAVLSELTAKMGSCARSSAAAFLVSTRECEFFEET